MRNTVLQYKQTDNKRVIAIPNLSDLYAYAFANELQYRNGILALREIEGDPPYKNSLKNAEIVETIDENSIVCSSYFTDNEHIHVDINELGFDLIGVS